MKFFLSTRNFKLGWTRQGVMFIKSYNFFKFDTNLKNLVIL